MLKWNYTYISSITNDEFTRYYLSFVGNPVEQKNGMHYNCVKIFFAKTASTPIISQ